VVTDVATDRAGYIEHLNHRTCRRGTCRQVDQLFETIEWQSRLRARIKDVLLGMRAPAAASTNWPSIVYSSDSLYDDMLAFLKCRDPNQGGTCHYRNVWESFILFYYILCRWA
jgi:hypothetical protein